MKEIIQTFNFQAQEVRTATNAKGEVYFCLADVANVLGIQNSRDVVTKQLDLKGVDKIYTPTNGGQQELTFINEPNLYRVIFRSNKSEARQFQDWVFNEVLPSIRKTGVYQTQKPMTPAEYLHHMSGLMLEQEKRLIHHEQRLDVIEARQNSREFDDNYFTIKGFCSLHDVTLTNSQMSQVSKKCKKLSDVKNMPFSEITDPRWGKVKIYHHDIIKEVLELQGLMVCD